MTWIVTRKKIFFFFLILKSLIKHNTMTSAPLTKNFFVLQQNLFPFISDEKILEFHHLPNQKDFIKLANLLRDFFSLQQQKVDIFSLGKNSKLLGEQCK